MANPRSSAWSAEKRSQSRRESAPEDDLIEELLACYYDEPDPVLIRDVIAEMIADATSWEG